MIHNGSVQPDRANSQEEADSETFVMGSDAAEFVNVKDQMRKRQQRMSNVADSGEEQSTIWGMFVAEKMNAAIHGKEIHRSLLEENVRHLRKIGERTGRD